MQVEILPRSPFETMNAINTPRPSVMSAPRNIRELLQAANDAVAAQDWDALDVTGAVMSSAAKVLRRMELEETHNRWSDSEPFTMEWAAKIVYADIKPT